MRFGTKHLLGIDPLSPEQIQMLLDTAESFAEVGTREIKKVPTLRGKTVVNFFVENSTRTRSSFELAEKRLSADTINFSSSTSSFSKGETLLDTLRNLEAMHADMFVVRHAESGAAHFVARHAAPHVGVINAGDGCHAHPTQAMLDMFTIRRVKGEFTPLTVAIVGDILHSRVARSQIHALNTLGVRRVRVIAPKEDDGPHDTGLGLEEILALLVVEDELEALAAAVAQLLVGADRDEAAAVEHADSVGHATGDGEVAARHEDGATALPVLGE